jgi:hypothetical protein
VIPVTPHLKEHKTEENNKSTPIIVYQTDSKLQEQLITALIEIVRFIKEGHICVNQKDIGEFTNFMADTPKTRESLQRQINQNSSDITELKLQTKELKTGTKILNEIKTNQEYFKTQKGISNREIAATIIGTFIVALIILYLGHLFWK